jgi:hypothetical protein
MRRSGAMRAIAIGLVLLAAAPVALSQEKSDVLTALDLYEACKDHRGAGSRYCRGVLLGFVGALTTDLIGNIWTWSCTGSDASLQIGYVAWAEKNAAKLDHDLREVLPGALVEGGFFHTVKKPTD